MTTSELPRESDNPSIDGLWQTKYRAERTKARLLGATTVAVSLLAVGLGAWGLNATGATAASGPGQPGGPNSMAQAAPPGATGELQGGLTRLPGGGPMGQDLATSLLNSDGSVNSDAVERLIASMPSEVLEQLLRFAVDNDELTQQQADEIARAATSSSASEAT